MPGIKRTIAQSEGPIADSTHPSRKRRVDYTEADAQQAKTYNDLADEIADVRTKAAHTLLKRLSANSPNQVASIREALTRLVKGLCSGRKAARIGFSIALSEVLHLTFKLAYENTAHELHLGTVIEQVHKLTEAESKASGQEKREYLLGRRFAFQAILQSNVALVTALSDGEWREFLIAVVQLARQKPWLRTECGAMLNEYLESVKGLSTARVQVVLSVLNEHQLLKSAEGLALWLSVADRWPEALPKDIWHKKDPLSSDELLQVKKIMQGSSADEAQDQATGKASKGGTRQSQPSFAWKVILTNLYKRKEKGFKRFWEEAVENGLFASASSAERKSLGLHIVSMAIATAPVGQLKHVLGRNTLRTIINHRLESSRTLFEASKLPLDQIAARVKHEPAAAGELFNALLAEGALDQTTKTKTIEVMVQNANSQALLEIATALTNAIIVPISDSDAQAEGRRRAYADVLLSMVRTHRRTRLAMQFTGSMLTELTPWVRQVLQALTDFGYRIANVAARPAISEAASSMFRARLMSCLSVLVDQLPNEAIQASSFVVQHLQSIDGNLRQPLSKQAQETLALAQKCRKQMEAQDEDDVAILAYELLFDLSIVPVYDEEADSIDALNDLISSFNARQEGGDSATMLVELLLSFVSKSSAVFRKLAERVFSTFAGELTSDSLQSLLDILQQKESLSGQQALFEQKDDNGAGEDEDSAEEDDDDELVDVDDMSDVELANGEVVDGSESDGSEEGSNASSDEESSAEDEEGDDEEAIFDRKLAAALGTTGMEDSDEDGSDMDDEQMLALEPHLANIFKERKKDTGKKQENKDAKENIVNFKNRVLDLLGIYVKDQYGRTLALDFILPLTALVRTTSSKPTAEKAFAVLKQYFEACKKHNTMPRPKDHDEACFGVLSEVHLEMKLGGSKLHANACSRSSLFLSKMLMGLEQDHYKRIADMYAELQSEWYMDPKSKVQGSVFTEWTSWSLATRKLQQQK